MFIEEFDGFGAALGKIRWFWNGSQKNSMVLEQLSEKFDGLHTQFDGLGRQFSDKFGVLDNSMVWESCCR